MRKTVKKMLIAVLCLLLLGAVMLPAGAVENAQPEDVIVTAVESGTCGAEGSDVNYTLYSDGTLVISGRGEIAANAFRDRKDIKKLFVKDGITRIGDCAFEETSVSTVVLPDSVTSIGTYGFCESGRIRTIQFGNGLETIEKWAFNWTFTGYASESPMAYPTLILPDSVKVVGYQSFGYPDLLHTIVLGPNVETVEEGAFSTGVHTLEKYVVLNGDANLIWGDSTIYSYAGGSVEAFANAHHYCSFVDLTTIEETDHDWDDGTVTRVPTCTAPGEMTYLCKTNPSHRKTVSIPTVDHVWCETVAATCSGDAATVRTCIFCGEEKRPPIPANGHIWDAGVVTTAPTCTEDGVRTFTCLCGATETEPVAALGHTAPDSHGDCTSCGEHLKDLCHWCGKAHGGGFDAFIAWLHSLLAKIFGAKY